MSTDDRYGIPWNLFGVVSEDFYGIVGRVTMLSTLVETKLLNLLWTLDSGTEQKVHAGKMSKELITLNRRFIAMLPTIHERGTALLDRTEGALGQRNEIVHSLWPNPGPVKAFRHRPLPKSKREFENLWTDAVEIDIAEIRQLIASLVSLVTELDDFRARVTSAQVGL